MLGLLFGVRIRSRNFCMYGQLDGCYDRLVSLHLAAVPTFTDNDISLTLHANVVVGKELGRDYILSFKINDGVC